MLVTCISTVSVYAQEYDIGTIIAVMDAYEQQVDSVKLTYSCTTCREPDGSREFTKGVFARKPSDGYVLLNEKRQQGTEWDETKEAEGILRAFDGEITRYFEHHTNKHGYHTGDLRRQHNPQFYTTRENPYLRLWGVNYKTRFTDLLRDPNAMPTVKRGETIDGFNTLEVAFKSYDGSYDNHLWLLPEKNYLPVKLHSSRVTDGRRICDMYWGDYKRFAGNIWHPMEIKLYVRDSEQPTIMRTEEIDFTPLTKQDFQFEFPPNTHVTDHVGGASYLTTPTEEQRHRELDAVADSLTNAEKEKVLDQYVEASKSDGTEDLDGAETGVLSGHVANIDNTTAIPRYWVIILAFGIVGGGILVARRKKHG